MTLEDVFRRDDHLFEGNCSWNHKDDDFDNFNPVGLDDAGHGLNIDYPTFDPWSPPDHDSLDIFGYPAPNVSGPDTRPAEDFCVAPTKLIAGIPAQDNGDHLPYVHFFCHFF